MPGCGHVDWMWIKTVHLITCGPSSRTFVFGSCRCCFTLPSSVRSSSCLSQLPPPIARSQLALKVVQKPVGLNSISQVSCHVGVVHIQLAREVKNTNSSEMIVSPAFYSVGWQRTEKTFHRQNFRKSVFQVCGSHQRTRVQGSDILGSGLK